MTGLLDPLELAAGTVIGPDRHTFPLGDAPGSDPRAALDATLAAALAAPPCRVAFSGGVDSSVLLALAAEAARERGLEPPIPVTNRFAGVATAEESEWQELVIGHLGLRDRWVRNELTDELDLVGDACTSLMREVGGVYWPWNLHFLVPLAAAVDGGGSLLTGAGGDELFIPAPWGRAIAVLERRHRPRPRDVPALLGPLTPPAVRAAFHVTTHRVRSPWLNRAGNARYSWRWAAHAGHLPVGWDRVVRRTLWPSRYVQVMLRSSAAVGRLTRVDVRHPFLEPSVLMAAARRHGRAGPAGRSRGMTELAGHLLPAELLGRHTKASFNAAFWGAATRRFAPAALDLLPAEPGRLVDRGALTAAWALPDPNPGTYSLLQAAWLSASGDGGEEDRR